MSPIKNILYGDVSRIYGDKLLPQCRQNRRCARLHQLEDRVRHIERYAKRVDMNVCDDTIVDHIFCQGEYDDDGRMPI